ncbi:MAG: MBL fold metallo-hydrolase, partial [Oscillospiraceae bacterium]|nr:MBL fold metallo-hydrolase [Oscillospiraceae bacterium]
VLEGISGHADKNGLLEWLGGFENKPQRVFVNHGDDDSCTEFTNELNALGYNAYAPYSGSVYNLFEDKLEVVTEGAPAKKIVEAKRLSKSLYNELVCLAEEVLSFVKACDGRANREITTMTKALRAFLKKHR